MLYSITYHGLEKWVGHAFERFGWLLLAKREMIDTPSEEIREYKKSKIENYGRMLKNLRRALEEEISISDGEDRKRDLGILHKNILTLIENYENVFGIKVKNNKNIKNISNSNNGPRTKNKNGNNNVNGNGNGNNNNNNNNNK